MNRYAGLALTAWIAAVVFVFPIPHTIALRNLLLVIGLLLVLATLRRCPHPRLPNTLMSSAWILAVLTAWIVLQAVVVAPTSAIALDNMRGDWIAPLLTTALAAWGASRVQPVLALRAGVAALAMHMLMVFAWQAWLWFQHGNWGFGVVPFGDRDYQSTLSNFLVALLLADRLAHLVSGTAPSGLSHRAGWLLTTLALASDILMKTRNGTAVALLLSGLFLMQLIADAGTRRRALPAIMLAGLAVSILGTLSWRNDGRWQGLAESWTIGWTSPSNYWLTGDPASLPRTPSQAPLEESAYARAAWARQSIEAIGEHPLGLGFGRDAFGRAVELRYGHKGMVSSHSGWLDFTLGTGLPGIALLLLTAGLAIRGGWQQFRQQNDGVGLLFSFFVGGYLFRILLDGHFSGWRLGLFAFICGVLIASMKSTRVAK